MGDGQQANNPRLQDFLILSQECLGIMSVSNADAKELGMTNEIFANGG
jgi:molybdopterin-containing oxidoreductase family iron-sulfur binding subunit